MKLTSYRLKDRVHIQDLDAAGLLTAEIEARLAERVWRRRLAEIRVHPVSAGRARYFLPGAGQRHVGAAHVGHGLPGSVGLLP